MRPLTAIRKYCVDSCMNHHSNEVLKCPSTDCPFYTLRFGKKEISDIRPIKKIKEYCIDCSDGVQNIKKCSFTKCPLFLFKKGKNPNKKGNKDNLKPILKRSV